MPSALVFVVMLFTGVPGSIGVHGQLFAYETQKECLDAVKRNREEIGIESGPWAANESDCCQWYGNKPCMNIETAAWIRENAIVRVWTVEETGVASTQ